MPNEVQTVEVDAEEARAVTFVESLMNGRVVKVKRLTRWRPAWFVDVDQAGKLLRLHLRGDRRSDVLPFPSLQREADILTVLETHGIPVPHVYGMCPDPWAIVMDAVPGVRAQTGPLEEQRAIAEQYMDLLARMHAIDVHRFGEIGLDVPTSAESIGLGMLDAYLPLYGRVKAQPEPLIEFAIAWARRNVPKHRTRAAFVHWDAGQFLHENGRITGLYDFETCLVGDPLMDLAAIRLRNPVEPLGADCTHLFRHYASVTGEPIDIATLRFHTVIFALVGVMALSGAMVNPQKGSPHLEYVWWDLMQRRALVWALAECIDVEIERPSPPVASPGPLAPLLAMVDDSLSQIRASTGLDRYQQHATSLLARCATRSEAVGPELDRATAHEWAAILGVPVTNLHEAAAAMESHARTAAPEESAALIQCFARQVERKVFALEPVADRVRGFDLEPVVL